MFTNLIEAKLLEVAVGKVSRKFVSLNNVFYLQQYKNYSETNVVEYKLNRLVVFCNTSSWVYSIYLNRLSFVDATGWDYYYHG